MPKRVGVRARPLGGAMTDDEEGLDHQSCVDAWMERSARGLTSEQLLEAFEFGFSALWHRAHRTLGDVTLTAIADRVLYNTAEQFPVLDSLAISATGVSAGALRARAGSLDPDEVSEAIRFVLVEFLTVLGTLTGDILTPSLHAQLSAPAAPEQRPGPSSDDRNHVSRDVDGAES